MRGDAGNGRRLTLRLRTGGVKLLRATVFLCLLFSLLIISANVLRSIKFRRQREAVYGFYAEEKNSIDIVSIGSSACYRYIDPPMLYELTGLTSWNLATASQPTTITKFIMREAEKSQDPQLFIVEAREFLHLKKSHLESSVHGISDSLDPSLNKWNLVFRAYRKWETRLEGFFDIAKYHGYWSRLTKESLKYWNNRVRSENLNWKNAPKTMVLDPPVTPETVEEIPLLAHNEKALIELLTDCREHGRNVLFVLTPFVYNEFIPGRALAFRRIVESYGYPFYDMTQDSSLSMDYSTDFYNRTHTNKWGAEKVTKALGEYIKKEYNIDAAHSPSVTARWDAAAAANRAEADALVPYYVTEEKGT